MFAKAKTVTASLVVMLLAASLLPLPPARGDQPVPIIPRSALFGNPDKAGVQISPDGQQLAFLASVNGVLNVWVGPVGNPDKAKPVTRDTHRGIRRYFWAFTSKHVIYIQDRGGDENWHVYSVDLKTDTIKDLSPIDGIQARVQQVSYKFPNEILIGINDRDPQLHDIYKVNITSGKKTLIQKNDDNFAGFLTEDDMKIHFGIRMTSDGGTEIKKLVGPNSWTLFTKIPPEDSLTTEPIGLDESGKNLFMIDSRNRNTAVLTTVNINTMESKVLAKDEMADIAGVMGHPTKRIIQAVQSTFTRRRWQILDDSIRGDFAALGKIADGEFNITSRTQDDRTWTVAYVMDNGPVRYYLYDRDTKKARFLFTNRKELENVKLATMHPQVIRSRDGLNLVSYYTLPVWTDPDNTGKPNQPLPMVLFVHGGPWGRDNWGYNSYHQWLANRGYAVLSVNYRGSTGFGKDFINASNFEWAGKMHDDLIDAVEWAIKAKIATRDKVAIMGGSYGGYATLVGLTFTPETFACGVDIVGPSNLVTLLESIPPYWAPMIEVFAKRVGDHRTEEGRKLLMERSPLTKVDQIRRPLLIGHGANDPRVKQAEADQIANAMREKNIPVTYVLYPDEGHGFARPENRISFNAVAESFLANHLGGRFQPMGEDMNGSSIEFVTGVQDIPGLPPSLKNKKSSGPT